MRQRWWALGTVIVVASSVGFAAAGLWQLDRLDQRRDRNLQIAQAAAGPLIDLGPDVAEYRQVTAKGTWLGEYEVALALQTREGRAGFHLLTPLVTDGGVYLVDRGWVPLDETADYAPASGETTIVATVRKPDSGRLTDTIEGGRRVLSGRDPDAVSAFVGVDLEPLVLELVSASPAVDASPAPPLAAEQGEGRHMLYAIQWFSFIGIVAVGYALLLRRQLRSGLRQTRHKAASG